MGKGMLVIETARSSELGDLVRMASGSLEGLNPEKFAQACVEDTCMVARETRSGRILGFAVARREEPCEGHIMAIAVDPLHRGEGVGSALLSGVRDVMLRTGAFRLSLEVRSDNRVARDFYIRHGFRPEGLHPGAFPDGQDAVSYGKPIR